MNPGAEKTNKMENPATDWPFIDPPRTNAVASVEPEDLSRFEGEGGHEAPALEWINVPLEHGLWRRHRWAADQSQSGKSVNKSKQE
jgi:hypothetical protein